MRLLVCALAASLSAAPQALAEPVISGMVTDQTHRPISGVNVSVWDEDTSWSQSARTDGDGRFSIKHRNCKLCFVEFEPKSETGLASALFERIPGDKMRQMLVELRRGFHVRGKITRADGSGVKGVVVKIEADSPKEKSIHGGGVKVTRGDGSFAMVLTPGAKKMIIINQRFPELVERVEHSFTIIEDSALENLVLTEKKHQ